MTYQAKNNAYSTLAGSLTNVATTLTVQAGHGDRFPVIAAPDYTVITLEDSSGNREVLKVTARTGAADTMTIARAQEGTTARAWAAGDSVELRMTAAEIQTVFNHVDDALAAHAASAISNTPSGNLAAPTVQAALNELQSDIDTRSPIASPTFTGTPAAPTATAGTNTTQLATTAFVLANAPIAFPSGTRMSFQQTSAPVGWTKDTTAAINDSAMRLVTGSVVNGGSVAFSTAFASKAVSGSIAVTVGAGTLAVGAGTLAVGDTTLSLAQTPAHTHSVTAKSGAGGSTTNQGFTGLGSSATSIASNSQGGGGSHTHGLTGAPSISGAPSVTGQTFTGTAINLAVKYYDFIIASKN